MIRLNAFFEVKDEKYLDTVRQLGMQLVEASRKDRGCVSYGLFESTTDRTVMMFCETWNDEESLTAHAASAHYIQLVPKIKELTRNGIKLERFDF